MKAVHVSWNTRRFFVCLSIVTWLVDDKLVWLSLTIDGSLFRILYIHIYNYIIIIYIYILCVRLIAQEFLAHHIDGMDREARGTFPIEESLAGKLYFRMCIPVSKWVVQHVITFMTTIDRPVVCGIYPSCIWWIPLSSWDAPSSANLECKTMVVFCRCPPNQPITSECYVHLQRLTQLGRVSKIGLTCCIFLCIYTNYSFIYIYDYI